MEAANDRDDELLVVALRAALAGCANMAVALAAPDAYRGLTRTAAAQISRAGTLLERELARRRGGDSGAALARAPSGEEKDARG